MTTEIQQPTGSAPAMTSPGEPAVSPFARGFDQRLAAGAVEIESQRAIAEAQGKLVIAQRFPRDKNLAYSELMEACKLHAVADQAFYSYPRGGEKVNGATIRLAEEIARCWGNIEYGIRELSRAEGVSEMEAFAWDLQTNVVSSQKFSVRHLRDKTGGAKPLTDERDIYEITANFGARRLRARILAVIPKWLEKSAVDMCKKTLANKDAEKPITERVRAMIEFAAKYGVTPAHLETYLEKKLDAVIADDLADLQGVFMAIRDGQMKVSDYFGDTKPSAEKTDDQKAILAQAQSGNATKADPTKVEPKKNSKSAEEKPAAKDAEKQPDTAPETKPAEEQPPKAKETAPAAEAKPAAAPAQTTEPQQAAPAKSGAAEGQKEDLF